MHFVFFHFQRRIKLIKINVSQPNFFSSISEVPSFTYIICFQSFWYIQTCPYATYQKSARIFPNPICIVYKCYRTTLPLLSYNIARNLFSRLPGGLSRVGQKGRSMYHIDAVDTRDQSWDYNRWVNSERSRSCQSSHFRPIEIRRMAKLDTSSIHTDYSHRNT